MLTRPSALLAIYIPLLFLSALLMFWVQPLIGKLILPLLGGTPMVWSTCMVFFQALLLAGYAYAHFTLRFGVRRQAMMHLVLVAISLAALPVGAVTGWEPPASEDPRFWLLGWMLVAVGMPFFVLSATAPMLQAWFSRTDHPDAHDPYFLYVTSNAGSLIGLLGFPLLVEPMLTLSQQSWTWSGTYIGFGVLIVLAALTLRRNGRADAAPVPAPAVAVAMTESAPPRTATGAPTMGLRLRWVALAFAPSSLLLGITTYVTTDIAAVPLLWIIPLAAYLITFMIAFAKRPPISHRAALVIQPIVVLPTLLLFFWGLHEATYWMMALHFVAFFITALVCHGELARTRPDSRHLTEFYLLMSLGGVLGGIFNALVAPVLFISLVEYPLVMAAALLLRPMFAAADGGRARVLDFVIPAGWLVGMLVLAKITETEVGDDDMALLSTISLVLALCCFLALARPIRFGLMVSSILAAGWIVPQFVENVIFSDRNFFGIVRVVDDEENRVRLIYHGTTQHGAQLLTPSLRLKPIAYYVEDSPIHQVFTHTAETRPNGHVAVVGLGAGTLACLGAKGQKMTFYEIDPAVEKVARDPNLFTYLKDCPPASDVILGDGRLTIARAPANGYDLIALDAFTSDAVPVHLLTTEAVTLYRSRLKTDGTLIFNISNRYLELTPVLAAVAAEAGMAAYYQEFDPPPGDPTANASSWVVMVPPGPAEQRMEADKRWTRVAPTEGVRAWTDGYSNLLSAIEW